MWWLLSVALWGCGSEFAPSPIDTAPIPDVAPTWRADIQPMLERHCARCHQPNGVSGLSLSTYDEVSSFAEVMLADMQAGTMPPPASTPECRPYAGSEAFFLPETSIDLFSQWIDEDMPLGGDPFEVVQPVVGLPTLNADLDIRLNEPFAPTFPDQGNEYRCFALDHGRTESFYITGMEAVIDQTPIVHHIVVYLQDVDQMSEEERAPEGFNCIDNTGAVLNGMIGGWAPGTPPPHLCGRLWHQGRARPDHRRANALFRQRGPRYHRSVRIPIRDRYGGGHRGHHVPLWPRPLHHPRR